MQLILKKNVQKNLTSVLCLFWVKNQGTTTTNSQPLKILLQKCKSWDLIENIFLCVSLVLIDLQRHTVPHFNDKFIINNSFYQIEAIRLKLQSPDLKIGLSILFVPPCNIPIPGQVWNYVTRPDWANFAHTHF